MMPIVRRPVVAACALALGLVAVAPAAAQTVPPITTRTNPNRVGINNGSPAFTLDVNGTANATAFRGDGSQLTGISTGVIGTPGMVPKFTGASTLGDSAIAEANGSVGVGTTAPASSIGSSRVLEIQADPQAAYPIASLELDSPSVPADHTVGGIAFNRAATRLAAMFGGTMGAVDSGGLLFTTTDGGTSGVRMIITNLGRVGIGTMSPATALEVAGTLTATTKNFAIAHPLEPDRKVLVHSVLEGPEAAVYYRGEATLVDGHAVITLPPYFEALTRRDQRTVQLTPIDDWTPLYVAGGVREGRFVVKTPPGGNPTQSFYWEVKAVRGDVAPLVVEQAKGDTR